MKQKLLSWADSKFDEEEEEEEDECFEKYYETPVDENGVKYSCQLKINEQGLKTRITRKIMVTKKIVTVNKRVEDRRREWKKFGRVSGVIGIEPGATYQGEEEVFLVLNEDNEKRERKEQLERDKKELDKLYISLISSPNHSNYANVWRPERLRTTGASYVPVHLRQEQRNLVEEINTTLRISHLSDELNENDIAELCRDYGKVNRIHLVRDKETHNSRGFAFVNFQNRSDAEVAFNALNGRGMHHLILCVEWAKPSIK
jgi:translation initiation factor 3 subunit G